jgi:hypothetical protein
MPALPSASSPANRRMSSTTLSSSACCAATWEGGKGHGAGNSGCSLGINSAGPERGGATAKQQLNIQSTGVLHAAMNLATSFRNQAG